MRQDSFELTEQLTSLYDGLSYVRQTLTIPSQNSNVDLSVVPIHIDPLLSTHYLPKPRSDSEPNILTDRQRIITIIEDLQ